MNIFVQFSVLFLRKLKECCQQEYFCSIFKAIFKELKRIWAVSFGVEQLSIADSYLEGLKVNRRRTVSCGIL